MAKRIGKIRQGHHNETILPQVQDRLDMKINLTSNLAAMVTRHGKSKSYLHRFKILDHATCACKKGDQTIDHLLYQCTLLEAHREHLKKHHVQRKMACKQTGVNIKTPEFIYKIY